MNDKNNKRIVTYQEQINSIMNHFDFDKIHKLMVMLDWKWVDQIPTASELKETALELLNNVTSEKILETSIGGFRAIKDKYNILSLSFDIDDVDCSWDFDMEECEFVDLAGAVPNTNK